MSTAAEPLDNSHTNTRSVYYTEMAIISGLSIIYSPILAPMHMINDIINLEAMTRGHYDKKELKAYSWFDIVFN